LSASVELIVRFIGFGKQCSGCGKLRSTTRYTLRKTKSHELIQQFLLCDVCVAHGYVVEFVMRDAPAVSPKSERRKRIRISRDLEYGVALDIGGKVQPGSGNKDDKADVRVPGKWRIEHKYTDNISGYNMKISDLKALIGYASQAGELPALVTTFRTAGNLKFATIPYDVFIRLMEKAHESD
jgi:hypothetical protein